MRGGLTSLDGAVIGGYLLVVLGVGLHSARKGERSTQGFFLARSTLPWWAAALSIIAAETSAVTYIGTPRMAFEGDWSFLQLVMGFSLGRVFLAFFLIPILAEREILTLYGYFEQRFGGAARAVAAFLFVCGRTLGSAVRLYAGCLALEVATGFPLGTSVLLLASFALLYTWLGGLRAVVWTDVLLGLGLLAGGLVSVSCLAVSLPPGQIFGNPEILAKTRIVHPGCNLGAPDTLVAGLLGGFFLTMGTHGTDQDVIQRVLACRGRRGGSLSILGSALFILPLMALFLCAGTLLHAHYRIHPPPYPLPENRDHLFPVFIVRQLPAGFAGLAMAGLLAAAVSSFASVINALAATAASDFYRPLRTALGNRPSEREMFTFSKAATLAWGAILGGLALSFRGSSDNVLNLALKVLTYFYGALLGTFLLAAFTRRGNATSVVAGMIASVCAVMALQLQQFLADPKIAPAGARAALDLLPEGWACWIRNGIPQIAWPYWIVLGTAVAFAIGALGPSKRKAPAAS